MAFGNFAILLSFMLRVEDHLVALKEFDYLGYKRLITPKSENVTLTKRTLSGDLIRLPFFFQQRILVFKTFCTHNERH